MSKSLWQHYRHRPGHDFCVRVTPPRDGAVTETGIHIFYADDTHYGWVNQDARHWQLLFCASSGTISPQLSPFSIMVIMTTDRLPPFELFFWPGGYVGARNTSRQNVSLRLMLRGLMLWADWAEDLAANYGGSFASKAQNYYRAHSCFTVTFT